MNSQLNKLQINDIGAFVHHFEYGDLLEDSVFLITGATGLIGSTLIKCLLALNRKIKIIAPIRNRNKALDLFDGLVNSLDLIECNLVSFDYDSVGDVDYIIHCAAPTSSKFFIEKPVETFDIILESTSALLKYASKHKLKSFVFLSSLEVYGELPNGANGVTEDMQGYWNPVNVRSSYPMAKRAAETLCCLYASEYKVPVKLARLAQTTGVGIAKDDNRIIAQFARLVANGNDIVLHTTGESARPYCYTTDCVSALLYILLKGSDGEAYNLANENTYISARGMAEFLRDNFNPMVNIRTELNNNMGYAPVSHLRLITKKLQDLGWHPYYGLKEIFNNLIAYIKVS